MVTLTKHCLKNKTKKTLKNTNNKNNNKTTKGGKKKHLREGKYWTMGQRGREEN